MSSKKRLSCISLVLCAALMLTTSFAGCNSGLSSSSGKGSSQSSQSSQGSQSSQSSQAKKEGVTFPYTGEQVTYKGYGTVSSFDAPGSNTSDCQKEWNKHIGNIKINWELAASSDFTEKSKLLLSSGDIPDVMAVYDPTTVVAQYASSGKLLDFSKYEDYMPNLKDYLKTYNTALKYVCSKDGGRYAIVGIQPIDWGGEGWWVNMDVLKKANRQVPNTFAEMLDTMRAVKKSEPNIVPFQSYWNIGYAQTWMATCMGAQTQLVYYDTADKKYKCSYREPSAKRKELIQTMADMYKDGLLNPEIQTMSNDQEINALGSGKWAFSASYLSSPEVEFFKVKEGEKLPFDIQPMTPPADENGNRYLPIAYTHDGPTGWGFVCSSKAAHPELLAAYMDQVVSPYGRDLFNYGIKGVTYDIENGIYKKKDVDTKKYGVGTQYEVWMVGMGPMQRDTGKYLLQGAANENNMNNFASGKVKAFMYSGQATPVFDTDTGNEKAKIENALTTYINENEAKFIYGKRKMSEWDSYVSELGKIGDIDKLLQIYNGAQIVERDPNRIFKVQ